MSDLVKIQRELAALKRANVELTRRIRADKRIPTEPYCITPENLHVFAEWQRIADKELGRV